MLKLSHKGLILVCVPLALELCFVGILFYLLEDAEYRTRQAERSRAIVRGAHDLITAYTNVSLAVLEYSFTDSQEANQRYKDIRASIPVQVRELKALVANEPERITLIERIEENGNHGLHMLGSIKATLDRGGRSPFRFMHLQSVRNELLQTVNDLSEELHEFARPDIEVQETNTILKEEARARVKQFLLFFVTLQLVIAIGTALYFFRGVVRRLGVLAGNSRLLAESKPLAPSLPGNDEIAEVDRAFHEMADRLKEVAQMKKEFAAMISHDLRTPLTSLQGLLALLSVDAYGKLNETGHQRVSHAERDITRLINLINELLDLEKMEAGRLHLDLKPADLDDLILRSIQAVDLLAARRGIKIDYSDTPAVVLAEGDRIVQVVVNLLSNAIKYSPDNGVISVRATEDGAFARISVSDQGPGVAPEAQQQIFERFKQAKSEDKKKGTGLGLAIAKALVQAHGGEIGVDSTPGAGNTSGTGSTFWFTLPLDPDYLSCIAEEFDQEPEALPAPVNHEQQLDTATGQPS